MVRSPKILLPAPQCKADPQSLHGIPSTVLKPIMSQTSLCDAIFIGIHEVELRNWCNQGFGMIADEEILRMGFSPG
ncbi:hypothetical protein V6N12_045601 [Hibiscus sabdariffa]|uniref:Uncharacterized protein n=1 Tax=Hibiscus sabdariffa TaxID=183260 RepID=A0ABR2G368_9ROSI